MSGPRTEENVMSREIRTGRWLQIQGRAKRAWGELVGNDEIAAQGNADVVAGAVEESIGVAKREISRGADALATFAKEAARSLER
jgi:uncharacterized protein YjbJ (UPF0337 family)